MTNTFSSQILFPISGSVALGIQGQPVFKPSRSLCDFVVDVEFGGHVYTTILAFVSNDEGGMEGYVDSPVVNCRFHWDSSNLPRVTHTRTRLVSPSEFVNQVIRTKALELLANMPESLSGRYGTYVSQLIQAGHVCRPHARRRPNSSDLIIVRGSIPNKALIDPAILPNVEELVATWNQIVDGFKATKDVVNFTVWAKGLEAPEIPAQLAA